MFRVDAAESSGVDQAHSKIKTMVSGGSFVTAIATGIAVCILGCLTVSGKFDALVMGGCITGFASAAFIASLIATLTVRVSKGDDARPLTGILAAVSGIFVLLGALAITGTIGPAAAGWPIVGVSIAGFLGTILLTVVICRERAAKINEARGKI